MTDDPERFQPLKIPRKAIYAAGRANVGKADCEILNAAGYRYPVRGCGCGHCEILRERKANSERRGRA